MEAFLKLVSGAGVNDDSNPGSKGDATLAAVNLLDSKLSGNNRKILLDACSELFELTEKLGRQHRQVTTSKQQWDEQKPQTLSGLEKLVVGDGNSVVPAETVYGQVELQNVALHKLLKSSIKKLSKGKDNIVLLEQSESEDEESRVVSNDDDESRESENRSEDSNGSDDDDDERNVGKRLRDRMAQAELDMEDDDDINEENDATTDERFDQPLNEDDFEKDRDAYNMHDGFFNLQEMEEFADEEEAYLPETAYGAEQPENSNDDPDTDKRSFHQKQREGDDSDGGDDVDDMNEDEDDGLLFRFKDSKTNDKASNFKSSSKERRKFRTDDEVDALFELYGKVKENDDEEEDAINMTAADLYGKHHTKYHNRYKEQLARNDDKKTTDKGDDDSWNDYDFVDSTNDDDNETTGWNGEQPRKDNSEDDDNESNDEDEDVPMKDSTDGKQHMTKQERKIQEQTETLEKELLAEKPWQMLGESTSTARPVNSLLTSTPEFDTATKAAPVIDVQHTENLEDIIKKRVLAEDWDDVVPQELPDVGWHKNRNELPEVSQEKSKLSLGELYEREYLKKATGYDKDADEKETGEDKLKGQLKTMFANLCSKLDALSNYHFAPRPVADEADIRAITKPAIAMEEALPIHVSDARGVAPEEVYGAKRGREGVLRADSELEQSDRKRQRGAKKAARRKARKAKLADDKLVSRLQPQGSALSNPYERRKMREDLSQARAGGKVTTGKEDMNDYGASTTFFKRMQKEAEQTLRGGKGDEEKNGGKSKAKQSSSSAWKL